MMDPKELVRGAIILLIGGYILWIIFIEFTASNPGFGKAIGWGIIFAFAAGAAAWLKGKL